MQSLRRQWQSPSKYYISIKLTKGSINEDTHSKQADVTPGLYSIICVIQGKVTFFINYLLSYSVEKIFSSGP